jgi:hypothetical protein
MASNGSFVIRRTGAPDPFLPVELSEVQRQVTGLSSRLTRSSFEATFIDA